MEDQLNKRALMEVKHQIPAELLGFLTDAPTLAKIVSSHVEFIRTATLTHIPRSWEGKIVKYTVSRVRQAISEKYDNDRGVYTPSKPFLVELLSEYKDSAAIAEDVMTAIMMINQMRRSAYVSAVLQA